MRKPSIMFFVGALSILGLSVAIGLHAASPVQLKNKAERVKETLREFKRAGGDPTPYVQRMQEVQRYIKKGNLDEAEELIDGVLSDLATASSSRRADSGAKSEQQIDRGGNINDEWSNPQKIEIVGFKKDAMEVGFSKDETMMVFNDKETPNKDLHWAKKISDNKFEYMGKIKGVNTRTVDASPVLDDSGKIYYTSTYNHDRLRKTGVYTSMYVGEFVDGAVRNPQPLTGNIYVQDKMWFSLDADVSPNGDTIYFSQGLFDAVPPSIFNIVVAQRVSGNEYRKVDGVLGNVNTDETLEYAPSISADGRELFFTRLTWADGKANFEGIFVAKRNSINEPFGVPERIRAITGIVEAPTIAENGKTLYYHKLDGERYKIFKVTRD